MAQPTNLPAVTEQGTLLPWLLAVLVPPMSRSRVKELLTRGGVFVNGAAQTRHDTPLTPGDRVTLGKPARVDHSLVGAGIAIAHEDDAVIVIDKPAGLLTVSTDAEKTDTAFARLSNHLRARNAGRPYVVHRLDRDTSGLLLFARNAEIRDRMQTSWSDVRKVYQAIVQGQPRLREGRIENHLTEGRDLRVRACVAGDPGAKHAVSAYRVLKVGGSHSLVEVELITGRKHQIRVHLNALGHPIIGDCVYGQADNPARRLGLHAVRLTFPHPTTGEVIHVESPLPEVLRHVVR